MRKKTQTTIATSARSPFTSGAGTAPDGVGSTEVALVAHRRAQIESGIMSNLAFETLDNVRYGSQSSTDDFALSAMR